MTAVEQLIAQQAFQLPSAHFITADLAILHEQPFAVRKGMAVHPCRLGPGGCADMGEEQR